LSPHARVEKKLSDAGSIVGSADYTSLLRTSQLESVAYGHKKSFAKDQPERGGRKTQRQEAIN
jgi:hypothetical protein